MHIVIMCFASRSCRMLAVFWRRQQPHTLAVLLLPLVVQSPDRRDIGLKRLSSLWAVASTHNGPHSNRGAILYRPSAGRRPQCTASQRRQQGLLRLQLPLPLRLALLQLRAPVTAGRSCTPRHVHSIRAAWRSAKPLRVRWRRRQHSSTPSGAWRHRQQVEQLSRRDCSMTWCSPLQCHALQQKRSRSRCGCLGHQQQHGPWHSAQQR